MKLKTLACTIAALAFAIGSSQAAITAGVNNLGGAGRTFSTSTGALLNSGEATMHVGYFLDWPAANLKTAPLASILAQFIPLGEGRPGLGATGGNANVGASQVGRATISISGITGTQANAAPSGTVLSAGTRLFVLVYTTAGTQFSIFSDTGSVNWVAPIDDPVLGGSTTLAVNTTNLDAANASTELFRGTYTATGINLEGIPEPGTTSLGLLAGLGLLARRRR